MLVLFYCISTPTTPPVVYTIFDNINIDSINIGRCLLLYKLAGLMKLHDPWAGLHACDTHVKTDVLRSKRNNINVESSVQDD